MPEQFANSAPGPSMLDCRPGRAVVTDFAPEERAVLPANGPSPPADDWFSPEVQVDVTVCIPNWNCRALLRGCLNSLIEEPQGARWEIIVVDNASTDGAAEMVDREFPDVVLIRNEANRGFARACNQAARIGRGRYLFFLNNDTFLSAGTLGSLVVYADAHPEVGIVAPRLLDKRGRPQVSCRGLPTVGTLLHRTSLLRWTGLFRRRYYRYRRNEDESLAPRPAEVVMGAAMMVPRDLFFALGGWDEDFTFGGEDFDLCIRIGRQRALIYLPNVEITHFGRVSTRENVAYSAPNVAIGFARCLRKSGGSPVGVVFYKLVATRDVPVQMLLKGLQYSWRRLRGRRAKAQKSLQAMREVWYFVARGLGDFWRV